MAAWFHGLARFAVTACACALASASCANAQPSLKEAVSVERMVITLPDTDVEPGWQSQDSIDAMNMRRAAYSRMKDAIIAERIENFQEQPIRWDDFVRSSGPNRQEWEFKGRVTPQRSVYIANLWTDEIAQMRPDAIELCVVTFDPSSMPQDLELRHYRLLYAVLVDGQCSQDALDVDREGLGADLARVIEPHRYDLRDQRSFENGVEVTVLSDVFERGSDAGSIGMIAGYLSIERPHQSAIVRNVQYDRGFFVLSDGEVVAFQSNDSIGSDQAVCVIRGAPWPEALEGFGLGSWPPREGTPDYRRFCLEELNAADEAYREWLEKSFEGVEIQMSPIR